MMKKLFYLPIIFLCACQDKSKSGSIYPTDSVIVEKVDTILSAAAINSLQEISEKNKTDGVQKSDWSSFRMVNTWKEDTVPVTPISNDKRFFELYGKLLKYSSDGSLFLDLDSYNIDIEKDEQGKLIGIEKGPDTEVSLGNLETKEKKRLLYFGPGSTIEEAVWQDDDNLMLLGVRETENPASKIALIWKYHLPTKDFYLYESADPKMTQRFIDWGKQRLAELRLK